MAVKKSNKFLNNLLSDMKENGFIYIYSALTLKELKEYATERGIKLRVEHTNTIDDGEFYTVKRG